FKRISQMEGFIDTVTAASVDEFVTIGAGFASSGHLAQQILKMLIDNAAAKAGERMRAAGLTIEGIENRHECIGVDTGKKGIRRGTDADHFIATNLGLLSLIADIGIGALGNIADGSGSGPALEADATLKRAQIRAMLDAQFAAFKISSAPADDLKRPIDDAWVL